MGSDDRHRPRFHLTCPNWMNDPIPFYDTRTGLYHVYYQHNPGAPVWGDMHWGHAVSRDLLDWEHRPVALAPSPEGPDRDGVWTGCVVRRPSDGRYLALYTAIPMLQGPFTQVQCAALSDDLDTWEKLPEPFLSAPPEGNGDCWRDPQHFVAPDGRHCLLVGGERPGRAGGLALLYRATDDSLTRWEYSHVLHEGDTGTGHDYECPDLFPLGPASEDWLLVTSRGKTWWHTGRLTPDMRLERSASGPCDGGAFYAAKSTLGRNGERLLFGWVQETRPEAEQVAAGWSGVLSLPRRVTAGPDGRPRFTPATTPLGTEHGVLAGRFRPVLTGGGEEWLPCEPEDACGEVVAHFPAGGAPERGLLLAWGEARLTVPAPAGAAGAADLHVVVDRSVVEAFSSEGDCTTHRWYPREAGPLRVGVYAKGGRVTADVRLWDWRKKPDTYP